MHLDEIQALVPEVLYDVGEILEKDTSRYNITVLDGSEAKFGGTELSQLEIDISLLIEEIKGYGHEKRSSFQKFSLKTRDFYKGFLEWLDSYSTLMFYMGGDEIYITPMGKRLDKDGTLLSLAHEVTHFLDVAIYDSWKVRKKAAEALKRDLELYVEALKFGDDDLSDHTNFVNLVKMKYDSVITLLESHADYVERKYADMKGISAPCGLKFMPLWFRALLSFVPTVNDDYSMNSVYTRGRKLLEAAEKEGVDFGMLLNNPPTFKAFDDYVKEYLRSIKEGTKLYSYSL